MTTREHLEFYARAKGILTIGHDVNLVLDKAGLKPYENRLASKLSGGNKRKLSLAIAILGEPAFPSMCGRVFTNTEQEIHQSYFWMSPAPLWTQHQSVSCGGRLLRLQQVGLYF